MSFQSAQNVGLVAVLRKRVLFSVLICLSLFLVKGLSSSSKVLAANYAIVGVDLDNRAGTIPITVDVDYYKAGTPNPGGAPGPWFDHKQMTVPVGGNPVLYSKLDNPDSPYYWINWRTDCLDPPAQATLQGLWGDGIGPGVVAYGYTADVHCQTPNATPAITNTACANVGWSLTGVGVNGVNISYFGIYMSQTQSDLTSNNGYPSDPFPPNDSSHFYGTAGSGARSYDFGSSGKNGTYYVRVRAVSPQGNGTWSSVGQFTCGAAITAASGLSVTTSCNGNTGSGQIVSATFRWTPASPSSQVQTVWLDVSNLNNNFVPGTYTPYGPLPLPDSGSYSQNNMLLTGDQAPFGYYWRINSQIGGNWYPSVTAGFFTPTCPVITVLGPTPTPTPTPGPVCPAGCTAPANITVSWGAETGYVSAIASTLFGNVTGNCSSANNSCTISNTFPANWGVLYNVLAGGASGPAIVSNGSTTTSNSGVATFNWNIPYAVKYCAVANSSATSCPAGTAPHPTYFLSYDITSPSPNQWYHVTVWTPCDPADSGCGGGVNYYNNNYQAGACNCPTPTPTPTPVPAVITLSGFSDCTDGVNPLVHLTWTSNTGATGYTVNRDSVDVTSQGLPSPLGSFDRSWNSTAAQPAGAHNWYVVGTGGSFPGTVSTPNPYPITTATCTPPPADPSNLQVTTACDATSSNPIITFTWQNNAKGEQGYWLDVSHDAFTGPSSTTATPSVWGVKGIPYTADGSITPTGVQFVWKIGNPTSSVPPPPPPNGTGPLDSGNSDSGVTSGVSSVVITSGGSYSGTPSVSFTGGGGSGAAGTVIMSGSAVTGVNITSQGAGYTSAPTVAFLGSGSGAAGVAMVSTLIPNTNTVYYWRVKAYSSDRQSNHVYPASTTVPPGVSFTAPTCMFDLAVENGPAGNTQVYDLGATANLTVRVYNTPQAQVNFTGGSGAIGFWPTTATLPNCSGSPQVPQTPAASQTISSTLVPGTDTHLGSFQDFTFTFTVSTTPGTYVANFYALPSCTPAENNNPSTWSNNLFQLTYAVSAKAWFQTVGGDVGANGNIQVSNPTPPGAQSSYVLAGNPLDASVVGKWELNNYAHPLFPTNNTRVYDYLNSRFRSKATEPLCVANFTNLAPKTGNHYFYCTSAVNRTGDMDVGGDLSTVAGTNNWVMFVDGNLTVSANFKLANGSTAVFIVRGNITVNTNVTQADGVYIAGGTFADYDNTGTKSRNTPPYQLLINGAVYAHAFDLSAFLSNQPGCTPTASACDNHLVPTDMVVFQPRYLIVLSQLIGSPSVSWQEVAP